MMFRRTIEDFTCERCGLKVVGNGYTDHCPRCLWGKHVDVEPGDRAATCGGMMQPIAVEGSSPNYRIRYRCERCGYEFIVNVAPEDDESTLLSLIKMV